MIYENKLNNRNYLTSNRKYLRKNLTPAEATLWKFLKAKQLDGIQFRRQFSIGNYILDFYIPKFKIGIELDGSGHFTEEGLERDKTRTEYLNSLGVEILRFENRVVFDHTQFVLDTILEKVSGVKNRDFI